MSVADSDSVASPSEGHQSFVRRQNGSAPAHANETSDDANFGRGNYEGGEEANVREVSERLRWTERERQHLLRKVKGLEEREEERKTLLENDRVRRENHSLRVQVDALADDCARWRNAYDNALHYLAVLSPNLAEIAEDDHFRIWKASL